MALSGYNSGSSGFIMVFNLVALPNNGTAASMVQSVGATSSFNFTLPTMGVPLGAGIVVAFSSTSPTLTLGSNSVFFQAVVL